MAAALSGIANLAFPGGPVLVCFSVALSGSYSSGGETLDFTTIATGLFGPPVICLISGNVGNQYVYANGTLASSGKMKLMVEASAGTNAPLTEHTAVAYVLGETADVIRGMALFK